MSACVEVSVFCVVVVPDSVPVDCVPVTMLGDCVVVPVVVVAVVEED